EANWWWLLAALLAAAASMHSFAQIQRTLLKSAGVHVKQLRSEAAFYAANSLSTTLPGGPVLSATFLLRQQRVWGASTVVASWQLVMSGVLQAVGLAVLGLGGAFFLGVKNNPFSLLFTLGGFVALLLLAQAVASRPELIEGIGSRVLAWVNSVRGRPADTGVEKWRETLMQLESVSLGLRGRPRGRHDTADAGWAAGRRGRAGPRPGVQWDVAAQCHLGDADLSADQ